MHVKGMVHIPLHHSLSFLQKTTRMHQHHEASSMHTDGEHANLDGEIELFLLGA
jgi:hypothetical protein